MRWRLPELPFVSRRYHYRILAAEQAETLRVKKVKDDWWQQHDRVAEELAAVSIINACLTEDLTKLREELAEARALADDSQVGRLRAELKRERRRGDRLQRQYDDAVGMNTGRGDVGLHDSEHWKPPISLDAKPGVTS